MKHFLKTFLFLKIVFLLALLTPSIFADVYNQVQSDIFDDYERDKLREREHALVFTLSSSHFSLIQNSPNRRTVNITTFNGKRLMCSLPSHPLTTPLSSNVQVDAQTKINKEMFKTKETSLEEDESNALNQEEENFRTESTKLYLNLRKQLRKRISNICFDYSQEYQTYQICPFKQIHQFHFNSADNSKRPNILLGNYLEEEIYNEETFIWNQTFDFIKNRRYRQIYRDGQGSRSAFVDYICPYQQSSLRNNAELLDLVMNEERDSSNKVSMDKNFNKIKTKVQSIEEDEKSHIYSIIIHSKYVCMTLASLPSIPEKMLAKFSSVNEVSKKLNSKIKDGESGSNSSVDVFELLEILKNKNKCLTYQQNYWTYEYCHLKSVSQYHMVYVATTSSSADDGSENSNRKLQKFEAKQTSNILLGKFDDSISKFQNMKLAVFEDQPERSYVVLNYVGGDYCSADSDSIFSKKAKLQRNVSVIFQCSQSLIFDKDDQDSSDHEFNSVISQLKFDSEKRQQRLRPTEIVSIHEPSSCSYVMLIRTPLLCKYPGFKWKQQEPENIVCLPLDSQGKNEAKDDFKSAANTSKFDNNYSNNASSSDGYDIRNKFKVEL